MGPFVRKRPHEEQPDCQTDYTVPRCGPEVDRPDGFGQRPSSKGPDGPRHGRKTVLLIVNAEIVLWESMQPARGLA